MRGVRGALTVADVAEYLALQRGGDVDRTTAWRWLKKLQREHGAEVTEDERGRLLIMRKELERCVARLRNSTDPAVTRELELLRQRLDETEARQNVQARELAEFRRLANEWLKRRRAPA